MVLDLIHTLIGTAPEGYELYEYVFAFILSMMVIRYLLQLLKFPMMLLPRR